MTFSTWTDKIMGAVIIGAVLWATWTTVQLYQIKSDLTVVLVRMERIESAERRIEALEAAMWPR